MCIYLPIYIYIYNRYHFVPDKQTAIPLACMQVRVPDVEFFVNLGDWPLEKRPASDRLHPIFSWCGSNQTWDIVMPTYDLTESVLETMGRQVTDSLTH